MNIDDEAKIRRDWLASRAQEQGYINQSSKVFPLWEGYKEVFGRDIAVFLNSVIIK